MKRRKGDKYSKKEPLYMIGAVSRMFNIHPQTLRLYEREGLLTPSRTEGKTRLYSQEDIEKLEFILFLIIHEEIQKKYEGDIEKQKNALVRIPKVELIRVDEYMYNRYRNELEE